MKVTDFTYAEYHIPLRYPLRTARGEVPERHGFLVAARDETGGIGVGDVVIMPKFGTESMEAARRPLNELLRTSPFVDAPDSYSKLPEWHASAGLVPMETPATVYGVECALYGLQLRRDLSVAARFPGSIEATRPILVNGIIDGDSEAKVMARALRLRSEGVGTLKLKVGILPLEEEIRIVRRLRMEMPDIRLRIDANCAWDLDTATEFCSRVEPFGIEYIEDPLEKNAAGNLPLLRSCCEIRIAIDELWSPQQILREQVDWSLCDVLIVKPVRVGSLFWVNCIHELAAEQKKQVVFTSMLDTSVGLACTIGFLHTFLDHEIAHGFETARMLATDTLTPVYAPHEGKLLVYDLTTIPPLIREPYRSILGIRG